MKSKCILCAAIALSVMTISCQGKGEDGGGKSGGNESSDVRTLTISPDRIRDSGSLMSVELVFTHVLFS